MLKITLDSFYKIQGLFHLLGLPGKNMELGKEYEDAMSLHGEKLQAIESKKHDLASQKKQEELQCAARIVDILNSRGIMEKGVLKIKVEKHKDDYAQFAKKFWSKSGLNPKLYLNKKKQN